MEHIDRDWINLKKSLKTKRELDSLIQQSELLSLYRPQEIIQIVGNAGCAPVQERDAILGELFSFVDTSELAVRMILHSLKPQIVTLVRKNLFADEEERAAAILSIASERIMSWKPQSHNFCHLSLYRSIARTTKAVAKKWECWEVMMPGPEYTQEPFLIDVLIAWIANKAEIDYQTARMVVLTRCDYLSIKHLSEELGENPGTLRQRRARAEKQIRESMRAEGLANQTQAL